MKQAQFGHLNLRVTGEDKESHTALCDEMKEWYGKSLYWLPYKFRIQDITDAFYFLKKDGDRNFSHLMQKLNT